MKRKIPDPRKGVKREKYNIPDELDLELKRLKIEKEKKGFDYSEEFKPLTDTQIKALFRDAVRRRWMYHPAKLSFLESRAEPDYDPKNRRIWQWRCDICGLYYPKEAVEVDHKIGGDRDFANMGEAPEHARGVLEVSWSDLQILCADKERGCHPIKSHSEKFNMSFEDAKLDKQAIAWEKKNKGIQKQREVLKSLGIKNADKLKAKEIRQAYIEYLKGGV